MDETHHATWIESTTTEAPTEPPTEAPIEPVVYHKSSDTMTYSEAISYCLNLGMEIKNKDSPSRGRNPAGYADVSQ